MPVHTGFMRVVKSGNFVELEDSQEKVRNFNIHANEFFDTHSIDNTTNCICMPKQASELLAAYRLLVKYSTDIIILKDGSIRPFVTTVCQEMYYIFLVCNQEKHIHFPEKMRKNSWQDVLKPRYICTVFYMS